MPLQLRTKRTSKNNLKIIDSFWLTIDHARISRSCSTAACANVIAFTSADTTCFSLFFGIIDGDIRKMIRFEIVEEIVFQVLAHGNIWII